MEELYFSNMTVGECNREAYNVAVNVVSCYPMHNQNPLVLWGPSGTGKTYLLHAIRERMRQLHSDAVVTYEKTYKLANYLAQASIEGQREELYHAFDDVNLFLLDNLEELLGKSATQEEVGNLLVHIQQKGAQIVLAAVNDPSELRRLRSLLQEKCDEYTEIPLTYMDEETVEKEGKRLEIQHNIMIPDGYFVSLKLQKKMNFRTMAGVVESIASNSLAERDQY